MPTRAEYRESLERLLAQREELKRIDAPEVVVGLTRWSIVRRRLGCWWPWAADRWYDLDGWLDGWRRAECDRCYARGRLKDFEMVDGDDPEGPPELLCEECSLTLSAERWRKCLKEVS